ncbi:hypothetical protein KAR91_47045 [Candidatus Pacearchaeota archaeon]|nr:hypothetical protein [Candidatus Pacearchaeota archaeon]
MRVEESEIYQDMRQYSENTRVENIRISTEYLKKHNIRYVVDGRQLFIDSIIFYPGIGKWHESGQNKVRFGVRNLVKYIGEISEEIKPKQLELW